MLVSDLDNYYRQFEAINEDARKLLEDLSESQFNWRPEPHRWSIGECINHLVVTGMDSLANMGRTIEKARLKGLFSQGPFRYRSIERWFVRQMEPPPKRRFKAPKAYLPVPIWSYSDLTTKFWRLQQDFFQCIENVNGIDLARTRVSNPVSRLFRFSLGQELAFNAAHVRRHLWQGWRVREDQGFPGGK